MKIWMQEDLQNFIDSCIEESLLLDYKHADALQKDDKHKIDISKDVSAMANSEGGMIIYGIKESKHLPKRITWVNRSSFTREWLESILNQNIYPRIDGLKIHTIISGEDENLGAYIVDIPKSNTIHQAKDFRYYKRYNFESIPMLDTEIRLTMSRGIKEIVLKRISESFGLLFSFFSIISHAYLMQKNKQTEYEMVSKILSPGSYFDFDEDLYLEVEKIIVKLITEESIFKDQFNPEVIKVPNNKGIIHILTEENLENQNIKIPVSLILLQGVKGVSSTVGNALVTFGIGMGIEFVEEIDQLHSGLNSAVSVFEPILNNQNYINQNEGRIQHPLFLEHIKLILKAVAKYNFSKPKMS